MKRSESKRWASTAVQWYGSVLSIDPLPTLLTHYWILRRKWGFLRQTSGCPHYCPGSWTNSRLCGSHQIPSNCCLLFRLFFFRLSQTTWRNHIQLIMLMHCRCVTAVKRFVKKIFDIQHFDSVRAVLTTMLVIIIWRNKTSFRTVEPLWRTVFLFVGVSVSYFSVSDFLEFSCLGDYMQNVGFCLVY